MIDNLAHSLHDHGAGAHKIAVRRRAANQHQQLSADRGGFIDSAQIVLNSLFRSFSVAAGKNPPRQRLETRRPAFWIFLAAVATGSILCRHAPSHSIPSLAQASTVSLQRVFLRGHLVQAETRDFRHVHRVLPPLLRLARYEIRMLIWAPQDFIVNGVMSCHLRSLHDRSPASTT